ncbi:hypothetical protein [Angustibacter sp. Root456]|uniref:hypothetical protein n=1 Tax=Angustibacter sp. Root456 TaxID=1736539 RepID=UPI0006FD1FD0|nr:hypothetical protein [Angustibacter sp. Root456]KQX66470.1 hypothetical protein ASD06_03520 [Angustibacter sp. Root456]
MRLYSALPLRAAGQAAGDVLLVVWIYLAVRAGQAVHEAVLRLAEPGRRLEEAGRTLGSGLGTAAARASDLPLVGDQLGAPLRDASGATGSLVRAGQAQQEAVAQLALVLAVVIAVVPALLAIAVWLPRRVRFVRRATAAQRFVDGEADLDLFAVRAMAHQPLHVLARISDDPAGAWRAGDRTVIRDLATLELRSAGLRPPPRP